MVGTESLMVDHSAQRKPSALTLWMHPGHLSLAAQVVIAPRHLGLWARDREGRSMSLGLGSRNLKDISYQRLTSTGADQRDGKAATVRAIQAFMQLGIVTVVVEHHQQLCNRFGCLRRV